MLVRGGVVQPAWAGKTVVCIATGPSLSAAQIAAVRRAREADEARVIAVNDAYLVAPFADVLYYADLKWRRWHAQGIARTFPWRSFSAEQVREAFAGFCGQRVSIGEAKPEKDTEYLRSVAREGLSTKPDGIATGFNSGHQALNIAALSGAASVLLLGYDGRRGQAKHVFGDHPDKTEPPYQHMVKHMRTTVPVLAGLGIEVFNCTPGSAIDAFPRGELESLLHHPARTALPQ
jgi:hypothetical protein